MEVIDIEKVERKKGVASTVKADDLIPIYVEGVQKFLRDNQSTMGDEWVKMVGGRLYSFSGKNTEGDILGSNSDMGVAIATFCPEVPLIIGQQLLGLYSQARNKNPFGDVYIDFGVQIDGTPKINPAQAKILLDDFRARGIEVGEGRVPNFVQLRLQADKDAGLVYWLVENASADNIAVASAYPFESKIRKDGLFRAYLGRGGWGAYADDLAYSNGSGRVVRYDAEGVTRAEPRKAKDLVNSLTDEFKKRF